MTNNAINSPSFPSVIGAAGKILMSDGTKYIESTPTYPSASGSSGSIIISNGTNNVYSTVPYPAASGWTSYTGTITLVGGAGNVVPTFSTDVCRYTQIGNIVFVSINKINSAGGTAGAGTGTVSIALPVTSGASASAEQQAAGYILNNATTVQAYVMVPAASSVLNLASQNTTTTTAFCTGATFNNANRQIQISFCYEV